MRDDRWPGGFTLIEIIIVIAIIGILAAIALPQFSEYRLRGYNILAESDVRNAATAEEAYYADNRMYTGNLPTLRTCGFIQAQGVSVAVSLSSNNNAYTIKAFHPSGDKTYTLTGPGGSITSD
jgi:type IV pilus assembly protein PilA